MPYGILKCDTVTFTNAGVDKSVSISGLVQNPTFSGNVTVTGTISGVTVTGTTASFTSGNFTNISGGTHTITSGVFATGSAANPSISFTSDPNTGIYSPGADQVAISTNGTGRLFVDATGGVQIDKTGAGGAKITSTVQSTVYFTNAANTGGYIIGRSIGSDNAHNLFSYDVTNSHYVDYFEGGSGGYRSFYTNGSERLRITSDGKVGLGTSSASNKLTIYEAAANPIRLIQDHATSSAYGIEFHSQASTPYTVSSITASHGAAYVNPYLNFNVADTSRVLQTRMVIDQQGRVGVGTTSPQARLHVNVATDENILVTSGGTGDSRVGAFNNAIDTTVRLGLQGNPLVFMGSGGAEVGRWDTSGRLLVGTSSSFASNSIFQVASTNNVVAQVYRRGAQESAIELGSTTGTLGSPNALVQGSGMGAIYFSGYDGAAWRYGAFITAQADGQTWTSGDCPARLVFSTTADGASSPTEAMRITSSQDLLIGTTTFAGNDGITLRDDGYIVAPPIYSLVVSASTRAIYMDSDGYFGYISSVRNSKTNIEIQSDVNWIYRLEPVTFNYKTRDRETGEYTGVDPQLQFGLIAEEVEPICPELCFYDETENGKELRGIHYEKLITPMLKALQQANQRIEVLEAEVASLKAQ